MSQMLKLMFPSLLLTYLLSYIILTGQNPPADIIPGDDAFGIQWSKIISDSLKHVQGNGVISSGFAAFVTILVQFIRSKLPKFKKKKVNAYTDPWIKSKRKSKHNVVLALGQGGSGKSSLIDHLHSGGKKELLKTEKVTHEESQLSKNGETSILRTCDYKGQDIGTFFEDFVDSQTRISSAKFKFGQITNLAIILDVVDPKDHLVPDKPNIPPDKIGKPRIIVTRREFSEFPPEERDLYYVRRAQPDEKRIKSQLGYWNKPLLDIVFSILPLPDDLNDPHEPGLKSVTVFINKLGLLSREHGNLFCSLGRENPYFDLVKEIEKRRYKNDNGESKMLFDFQIVTAELDDGPGNFVTILNENYSIPKK